MKYIFAPFIALAILSGLVVLGQLLIGSKQDKAGEHLDNLDEWIKEDELNRESHLINAHEN